MAKAKKKKVTLESLDTKIDRFREAVISGFEHLNEKIEGVDGKVSALTQRVDSLETQMMKMRDDIRAIDGKVSGIWNVLDAHTDRLKKLEAIVFRSRS
jgi:chromosome segregation ATPase